jgi:acetyl esterase/lipase
MKRIQLLSITFLILFICSISYVWSQEVTYSRTEDVIYGRKDGMALTMDVFQPEKPNGIGAVLLISGGWYSAHDALSADWITRIKKLLGSGETVFAVVHSSMPKYKIPDIQKDVERAIRFIRFNSAKWNVNPEMVGIVGHSSGAHLALLHTVLANDSDVDAKDPVDKMSSKVQAIACFYPPTDFLFFGAKGINALANPRFQKFLPAFVTSVNDTTGLEKIAGMVSPIRYVTASMPPTLIISGTADKLVPFQQSQLFIDKLNELKVPCRLEAREGKDHGWSEIADDYKFVAEWFEKYLKK